MFILKVSVMLMLKYKICIVLKETKSFQISPLVSPSSDTSYSSATSKTNTNPPNKLKKLSSMSFVPVLMQPISAEEQLKIESFYRSFGTSIYTSNAYACLYTMVNSKTNAKNNFEQISIPKNRASIAVSTGNTSTILNKTSSLDIDHGILKDFMNNRYQNHVSVYHRGVPLWLFNSGSNPRRPNRQLKFTLAEKGTGFILWQVNILNN